MMEVDGGRGRVGGEELDHFRLLSFQRVPQVVHGRVEVPRRVLQQGVQARVEGLVPAAANLVEDRAHEVVAPMGPLPRHAVHLLCVGNIRSVCQYTPRMSSVKSRRDQFSEATRAALLEAATRRFATLGYAGTSLEDVATDIQATRGAVYHHFSSKKALFEAVFAKLETDAVEQSRAASRAGTDPWQGALLAMSAFLDTCTDPVYGRIVWQEAPIALGWARWEKLEEAYAFGLIEEHVRNLVEGGYIEALPLDTMTRVAFAMLGAAGQALAKAPESDKERVKAEYSAVIARLLAGLSR